MRTLPVALALILFLFVIEHAIAACPSNFAARLSSNVGGSSTQLTICQNPPGPSAIIFTCTATSTSSNVGPLTYRFFLGPGLVQESSSNIYTITVNMFNTMSLVPVSCVAVAQNGQCFSSGSQTIFVSRCVASGNCPIRRATLISNVGGCGNQVTICRNPPGPSSIVFTCISSPAVPAGTPVTYRFFLGMGLVQATSSNTYTVTFSMFQNMSQAPVSCVVVTPSGPNGQCFSSSSNSVSVVKCA